MKKEELLVHSERMFKASEENLKRGEEIFDTCQIDGKIKMDYITKAIDIERLSMEESKQALALHKYSSSCMIKR